MSSAWLKPAMQRFAPFKAFKVFLCVFSTISLAEPPGISISDDNQSFKVTETAAFAGINSPIGGISPTALTHSFSFLSLHLQVSRRSHEHVWRKPAQHSLQTVPSAPGQPAYHRATRGGTPHLIYGRHQRHADHAALDCKSF